MLGLLLAKLSLGNPADFWLVNLKKDYNFDLRCSATFGMIVMV